MGAGGCEDYAVALDKAEELACKYRDALQEISDSPHGTDHCKLKKIADKALGMERPSD